MVGMSDLPDLTMGRNLTRKVWKYFGAQEPITTTFKAVLFTRSEFWLALVSQVSDW